MNQCTDFLLTRLIRIFALLSFFLLITAPVFAEPVEVWSHFYSAQNERYRMIKAIIPLQNGGYILGGLRALEPNVNDITLTQINADGDVIAESVFDQNNADEQTEDMTKSPDGGWVVTGTRVRDLLIVKFNEEREMVWTRTWGGAGLDQGKSIVPAIGGGYVVCGFSGAYDDTIAAILMRYPEDGEGDPIWIQGIPVAASLGFIDLALIPDGYIAVGNARSNVLLAARFDAEGDTVWTHKIPVEAGFSTLYRVRYLGENRLVVAGIINASVYVAIMNLDGEIEWSERYENVIGPSEVEITETPTGFFLACRTNGRAHPDQWWLATLSENGELTWSDYFGAAGSGNIPFCVLGQPDGTILVGGMGIQEERMQGRLTRFQLPEPEAPVQILALSPGWNIYSTYLSPDSPNIRDMFASLVERGTLRLIKDGSGRFYAPLLNFCNLPNWNPSQGYFINMAESDSLTVSGVPIPIDTPIVLNRGWGIVAYYPENELSAADAFANIHDALIIAKDGGGRFYLPDQNFSNMGNLRRGVGYYLKMNAGCQLVYPNPQGR